MNRSSFADCDEIVDYELWTKLALETRIPSIRVMNMICPVSDCGANVTDCDGDRQRAHGDKQDLCVTNSKKRADAEIPLTPAFPPPFEKRTSVSPQSGNRNQNPHRPLLASSGNIPVIWEMGRMMTPPLQSWLRAHGDMSHIAWMSRGHKVRNSRFRLSKNTDERGPISGKVVQ